MLIVSQAILVVVVARVWWSYHVHVEYRIPLVSRHTSGGVVEGVERGFSKGVRCSRRARSARLAATWRRSGNRTGEERIYECRHVTGSGRRLHPGVKRALETPAAAASDTTGDVAESEAERLR